jgi:hypothetical protein
MESGTLPPVVSKDDDNAKRQKDRKYLFFFLQTQENCSKDSMMQLSGLRRTKNSWNSKTQSRQRQG